MQVVAFVIVVDGMPAVQRVKEIREATKHPAWAIHQQGGSLGRVGPNCGCKGITRRAYDLCAGEITEGKEAGEESVEGGAAEISRRGRHVGFVGFQISTVSEIAKNGNPINLELVVERLSASFSSRSRPL